MKKSTKEVNPSYIVNIDDIESLEDIQCVWALAKHNAGLSISNDELLDIVNRAYEMSEPKRILVWCEHSCDCTKNKASWYKRLWNWIRRK